MVSAAELKALHSQHNGADSSTNGNTAPPIMDDPFPALTEDPFPPPPTLAPATFSASTQSIKAKQPAKEAQPDLSSHSAFPSLGGSATAPKGQWGAKLSSGGSPSLPISAPRSAGWKGGASLVRATAQEVFSIPTPTDPTKLSQAIARLHAKHKSVKVEASSTRKTATTTFVLKAASEKEVKAARRELTVALAKVVSLTVMIPSSLRAHVIGAKGKNLKAITESTGVRINIPKQEEGEASTPASAAANGGAKQGEIDYDADVQIAVTIDGDEINANSAARQIQALVGERTSRTTVRLANIEHIFYPFIAGAKGAGAAKLESQTGNGDVTVRVPPRAAFLAAKEREEEEEQDTKTTRDLSIVVSGDKEQVNNVVTAIEAQVDDMKRSFRILTISIPKRQHRFLVGDAAQDIFATTGCSVELASIDDPSDSVTIRGPPGQLPTALTAAMEKANAVRVEVVDLTQAHRGVAGAGFEHAKLLLRWLTASGKLPRGANGVQVFTPRPALIESSSSVQIEIVGSDAESVASTRAQLEDLVKATPPSFVKLIEVDSLLHRFIIGKKGAGLQQYAKRGVDVAFPPLPTGEASGEGRSDVALIFIGAVGEDKKTREAEATKTLEAVAEEVQKAAGQAADLKTEVLSVAQKLHAAILGPRGTTLNAIIGEDRLVNVQLGAGSKPAAGAATAASPDSITVRGPSSEVTRVVAELKRIAAEAEQDAIVNGHVAELSVDAVQVPHLVGRAGSAINKLRNELGVRIDIDDASAPNAESSSSSKSKPARSGGKVKVTFTGRKGNVEEAKKRFAAQSVALADEVTATLKVPENLRGSIIGSQGKYVSRLRDTYSVRINFPSAGEGATSQGDESQVVIRGPKKGVEGAKAEIIELLEYEKTNNQSASITVSTKSIPRLMGKGGETINRIRDDTEAQVDVERDDKGKEGTKQIKIRGTKAAIDAARGALLAIAKEVDAEETYTLTIDPKYHALLLGARGSNLQDLITRAGGDDARNMSQLVQFPRRGDKPADQVTIRGPADLAAKVKHELEAAAKELSDRVVWGVVVAQPAQRALMGALREVQSTHSVRIFMPNFREYDGTEALSNADEVKDAAPGTVVKLQGTPENVKAATKDISANYTSHSRTVTVSRAAHAKLANAQFFRSLRNDGVSVDAPRSVPATTSANGASNDSAAPAATATEARIDVDAADDAGSSDWELKELPVQTGEPVTWTLTARDEASLAAAAARISELASAPEHTHEGKLLVEASVVPRLVGKQGAALREHENASGATIEIPRNANGLVVIRGTLAAVEAARERIQRSAARPPRRDYE